VGQQKGRLGEQLREKSPKVPSREVTTGSPEAWGWIEIGIASKS